MVIVGKMMVRGEGSMMRHKNIRCIGGKPMIYWALKHALDAGIMDDIFVFTEDETAAQVTASYSDGRFEPTVRVAMRTGDGGLEGAEVLNVEPMSRDKVKTMMV